MDLKPIYKKNDKNNIFKLKCARGEIRTRMPLTAPPPQDGMSTNFTTRAF